MTRLARQISAVSMEVEAAGCIRLSEHWRLRRVEHRVRLGPNNQVDVDRARSPPDELGGGSTHQEHVGGWLAGLREKNTSTWCSTSHALRRMFPHARSVAGDSVAR